MQLLGAALAARGFAGIGAWILGRLHLAIAPVLLGAGEHLLNGIDMRALGYECTEHIAGARATHVILRKRS